MITNGSYAAQLLRQFELEKLSVEQAVPKMHHLFFLTMLISVLAKDFSCIEMHAFYSFSAGKTLEKH